MNSLKFKLLSIFFLSGFSSLIYQVVWQKALSQIIGVDHISVTLIISLFMLGLGLGGAYGGKLSGAGGGGFLTFVVKKNQKKSIIKSLSRKKIQYFPIKLETTGSIIL